MHRSKLSTVLVDAPAETFEKEVDFWAAALGRTPRGDDDDPEYRDYGQAVPGVRFMVQEVGAPARVHFDIESDDVEAEVRRLEALGAQRVEQNKTCWVMRDPGGLLFCVVRVQTGENFESLATRWPDAG